MHYCILAFGKKLAHYTKACTDEHICKGMANHTLPLVSRHVLSRDYL